ncbi:farnesyl diphosphate synthase [Phycomyces blakesleeanus]|uniref:Farnesyl diphosphate synthase n=2 Tax=Phycomyces blakesleeanus TaxID=4837 RepID=A0A167NPH3_PHYB8|nr:farnesyl diphosphate synthase [Phycomyces blakesleeanus NRRL 1555(-)]OAD76394.1 farnesyl diphosphate synthase [Phycomyces blakesleeanus NRRL 1555(-)]|eukprot:XP_018294434.1 farnesyl diphosphate synthase [Phycomyces blakesleeanus NRRL 1555(-)]
MAITKKEENRQAFLDVFKVLKADILNELRKNNMPEDAYKWTEENLEYNVPGGKLNRGLSVVDTLRILKGDSITEEEIFNASILGWLVELLQAFFLVSDDMMDASITRRGQPCWYRKNGVGLIAINDSFILEGAIYVLLKKYFKKFDYYVDLLELFHEVSFQTELGQLCDLITAPEDNVDLSKFSIAKHKFIVIYKTAFYSFYLPVALAMHMAGVKNEEAYNKSRDILIPLGEYFQIQDDYLDCYGAPEVIGKIGTDIMDNKCSWLINQALFKANPEQRAVLEANYGQKNSESEAKVKKVFLDLGIEKIYKDYEEKSHKELSDLISQLDESVGVKKAVFIEFMDKIYKRTK